MYINSVRCAELQPTCIALQAQSYERTYPEQLQAKLLTSELILDQLNFSCYQPPFHPCLLYFASPCLKVQQMDMLKLNQQLVWHGKPFWHITASAHQKCCNRPRNILKLLLRLLANVLQHVAWPCKQEVPGLPIYMYCKYIFPIPSPYRCPGPLSLPSSILPNGPYPKPQSPPRYRPQP